jgi:predicted ATPase/transcriptional regulator with XRE-family HTH domain
MELEISFGRWLRARRRALDLTQHDLARQVGCSVVTIRKIEADERRPSRQIAERLADCLKVAADERAALITLARAEPYLNPAPAQASGRPLPAPHRPPSNLPAPLTRLIGRKQDLAAARNALMRGETRLLTLVGPPGIGKTRLSTEVARDMHDAFVDGAYFVALAPLGEPALVLATIAQMLGVKETAGQPLLDQLKVALQAKRLLIVLDNFEHLLDAAPPLVELLEACPGLKALVTSRAALHVRGERLYTVPPLLLPDLTQLSATVLLARNPAVALFVERAQALLPEFRLTEQNAAAVAAICVRLDGLPLAIELAATRIKLLPPEALLVRLEQRLAVLTDGARDLPPRHRTLRAAITWSYELLDAGEQKLFRRLGVFVGGCTLAAAEAVCNASGDLPPDVLDGLASLVDNSMLQREQGEDGEPRFVMLETIREYALERLEASGETQSLRQRHAAYYLKQAELALQGVEQRRWLTHLECEHDNLRATLAWSQSSDGDVQLGLRLGGGLWLFWLLRGYVSEGRAWLADLLALAQPRNIVPSIQAKALHGAGVLATYQGDYIQTVALCHESLALYRILGDMRGVAWSLNELGSAAHNKGDFEQAMALYQESLTLFRTLRDRRGVAELLSNQGRVVRMQGDYGWAIRLFQESLDLSRELEDKRSTAIALQNLAFIAWLQSDHAVATTRSVESLTLFRELGDPWGTAQVLNHLGLVAREQGDDARAHSLFEESLAIRQELGDQSGIALVLYDLGRVRQRQGDLAGACRLFSESLTLLRELKDKVGLALVLEALGQIACVQRDGKRAAQLFGAAEDLYIAGHVVRAPVTHNDYHRTVAAIRAHLDEATFAAAWAEGRAMTLEQAIAYALGEDAVHARM